VARKKVFCFLEGLELRLSPILSSHIFAMFKAKRPLYSPVPRESEEKSHDDSHSDDGIVQERSQNHLRYITGPRHSLFWLGAGVMLSFLLFSHIGIFMLGRGLQLNLDRQCLHHTSAYCKYSLTILILAADIRQHQSWTRWNQGTKWYSSMVLWASNRSILVTQAPKSMQPGRSGRMVSFEHLLDEP
jgi:hypothetical protein